MARRPRTRAARRPARRRSARRGALVGIRRSGARGLRASITPSNLRNRPTMSTVSGVGSGTAGGVERRPVMIAVVDDDSGFAGYLRTFLALRGYEARAYARGDETIAAIRQGEPPDIVLL